MPSDRPTPDIPKATLAVVQGMLNPGRARSRFEAWAIARAADRASTRLREMRAELQLILEDVAENGPAWTGASSGRPGRAIFKGFMPKWHPASGMTVGNERGDSGWQIAETARRAGSTVSVALVNPMWDPYLKYVEAGVAPATVHSPGGFVREAWGHHLQRRRL